MSDDEYYYDDDDEWYWYEEDNMGIGDDLAETAVYSPIMVEDPSLEIADTYSDWEYYSDDYYDDDPTIIARQNKDSSVGDGNTRRGEPLKKKRKLSSLENIPNLSLGSSVFDYPTATTSSFKGVIWKLPVNNDKKVELYEPGNGEKVALLRNWRDLVKTPRYHEDWFPNESKTKGHEMQLNYKGEDPNIVPSPPPTAVERPRQQELSDNVNCERYSPPPLAIENMDESINRQREKLSESELKQELSQVFEESMDAVNIQDEELDEETSSPDSVATAAADNNDKENTNTAGENEQLPHKMSIRVEVPSLAATMKQDISTKSTSHRKRGRKPKSNISATAKSNGSSSKTQSKKHKLDPKSAQISKETTTKSDEKLASSKKKGKKEAEIERDERQKEKNDNIISKRRSKRVALSADTEKAARIEPNKKRTRTTSLSASQKEEPGKRRRI